MPAWTPVPESEVLKLGSEQKISAHLADEGRFKELAFLCEDLEAALQPNSPKREQVLAERPYLIAHADKLAAPSASPLLTAKSAAASKEWARVRALLVEGARPA
ncbi:MAG: hypothetical protein M3Y59_23450 [Myxococcota bacterium]|nr:hypothetical protein [Myxococcota bacterium]